MSPDEKAKLLQLLESSNDALPRATRGLTEGQAGYTPEAGRWSAKDVVEHVAVAEEQMFMLVTQLRRPATPGASDPRKDALLLGAMDDRATKREAPPTARPTARFATLQQALEHFESRRARTLEYVTGCTEDLRAFTAKHPLAGVIDCYQCLLMIATHPLRHEKQIEELKAHPSFPKA